MNASESKVEWYKNAWNCCCFAALILAVLDLFFILLLWNFSGKKPDLDALAVSISILQMFVGVVALGGFFLIRSAAQRAAEDEARSEFAKFEKTISDEVKAVARRTALEYLDSTGMRHGNGTSSAETPSVMFALDDEEDGNGK